MKKREMMSMQAVLYALAMKVLNEDEMKRIEEMMTMTLLGQMLMEDGMKKGMEKGEFKNGPRRSSDCGGGCGQKESDGKGISEKDQGVKAGLTDIFEGQCITVRYDSHEYYILS